jgi:hypothetical protein
MMIEVAARALPGIAVVIDQVVIVRCGVEPR